VTHVTRGIHPSAIVEDGARIGDNVEIGAFCLIGSEAEIADGAVLRSHVVVEGRTHIGSGTVVFPHAVIGAPPQDIGYRGEETSVQIGSNCIIREHVTVHRGTARGRGVTRIGDDCFLMVGVHVAHDCDVGNHVVIVNSVAFAGHVTIGDHAIISGLTGVQQRSRIGAHAFIGGLSSIVADVIPFAVAFGNRAELAGLNIIGLKRRGFDRPTIHALRAAYQAIFNGVGTLQERVDTVATDFAEVPPVMQIVEFIRAGGDRPLTRPRE
jgi:UDP-N-acetylglucosamine acyltransferase